MAVEQISKLPNLNSLYLEWDRVTDVEVARLRPLTKLQEIEMLYPTVTDEAIADLQKALPRCKITVQKR